MVFVAGLSYCQSRSADALQILVFLGGGDYVFVRASVDAIFSSSTLYEAGGCDLCGITFFGGATKYYLFG